MYCIVLYCIVLYCIIAIAIVFIIHCIYVSLNQALPITQDRNKQTKQKISLLKYLTHKSNKCTVVFKPSLQPLS